MNWRIIKMKFTTHNEAVIETSGTHLQGYVSVGYEELVRAFGEPLCGDGHKVDAEWNVCFEDGTRATIYNWKNGKNYCGDEGQEVQEITEWNIGGHDKGAVPKVIHALYLKATEGV
jgi:hypothetical protein